MSQSSAQPARAAKPADSAARAPTKRRRWWKWLLALLIVFAILVFFLPNLVALPWARQRLLDRTFGHIGAKATVKELSLGWFSPVSVGQFELQADESGRNTLSIKKLDSEASLLNLLFRHDAGVFHVDQPELYVQFDKDGNNLARLFKALGGSSWGDRATQIDIADGRLLLRGPNSAQPWTVDKLNLNVSMTPASDTPAGVPVLQGTNARLLQDAELTPEMCNDIIKFVVPPLANTTRTSGRVSLTLDDFHWPLGKPNEAQLKGQLRLDSVNSAPSEFSKALAALFKFSGLPPNIEIAKQAAIKFEMHDGRVYNDNLVFRSALTDQWFVIRSHGSVGLDETLDLSVEISPPEDADFSAHPMLKLLKETPLTMHIGGTLSAPAPSLEHSPSAVKAVQALSDFLQRRAERRQEQGRPALVPGRSGDANSGKPSPPAAK